MAFQKVGIEVSKTRDFARPLGFAIPDGDFGRNSIPAESLEPETEYFVRAYFDQNGMRTWSDNIGRFWTAAPPQALTFHAGSNGGRVQLIKNGSPANITLDYTTDGGATWTTWSSANGNLSISLSAGESATLKGDNNTFSSNNSNRYTFYLSGITLTEGNVMSLLDSTMQSTTIPTEGCFYRLFHAWDFPNQCDFDIELPATTLTDNCYRQMFTECVGMTKAPELPATVLTDGCYASMFQDCTALTQAPAILPATTLTNMCYNAMFLRCSALTQAPVLPATQIHSYTACYNQMFKECSLLSRVEVHAQTWGNVSETYAWLEGVAATGDFYNLGGATIPTGTSGIPSGWTEHTSL